MKPTRAFVVFLSTIASLSVLLAAPAAATTTTTVHCGDIIKRDTTLANDLRNCPRHGLIIGAANITLDLNGHTVDGDDVPFRPCPLDEPCDVGIVNSGIRNGRPFNGTGFDGVVIKNGAVTEFPEVGVYITDVRDNIVRSVRTSKGVNESDGVHLRKCVRCGLENSSASGFLVGFVVERSRDVLVTNNDVFGNNGFAGVLLALSEKILVAGNRVHDNVDSDGIKLLADSNDNVVRDNVITANGAGIAVFDDSDRNVIAGNVVADNAFVGIYTVGGAANSIVGNDVARSGQDGGIHLFGDAPANGTVIAGNFVYATRGDGVVVDRGNTATRIERNHADHNADDGIDVNAAATTIVANSVYGNGDLGIEAVGGVTDGSGNRASGNGNPAQCTYVRCQRW